MIFIKCSRTERIFSSFVSWGACVCVLSQTILQFQGVPRPSEIYGTNLRSRIKNQESSSINPSHSGFLGPHTTHTPCALGRRKGVQWWGKDYLTVNIRQCVKYTRGKINDCVLELQAQGNTWNLLGTSGGESGLTCKHAQNRAPEAVELYRKKSFFMLDK